LQLFKAVAHIGGGSGSVDANSSPDAIGSISKKRSRKEVKKEPALDADGTPVCGSKIDSRVKTFFNGHTGMDFKDGDVIARTDAVKYLHKRNFVNLPRGASLSKVLFVTLENP
jgi:hypothetical protein